MRSVLRALPLFFSLAASAADPAAVLASARQAWPDNADFAVVCNYGMSREAVQNAAYAASANGFRTLTVVDVHQVANMGGALSYLAGHNTRLVLLLPKDPVAGDGTFGATALLKGLNGYGIPACSTRSIALKQGAAMAQGEDTNGLLLTQGVEYTFTKPTILKPVRTSQLIPPAEIRVVSFR
ncbi:MAG TPA: hypothetical protein VFM84_00205 [Holophagaceae bacterium]|nr:hypothetical protein [Holophagaceae bacterium]